MSASDRASPWVIVVALSLLLGLQPIATDLYLPALPQMQRELGWQPSATTWTLSALIMAFGLAQLVWGPVADRVGRRPVLLSGLGLFVLASGMTVASNTLVTMIAARALQGAALAASVVCGRAIIRDLYPPEDGARVMAKAMGGLGALALLGPLLGAQAALHGGWRVSLAIVGGFGALTWAYVFFKLPESWPAHRRTHPTPWGELLSQWRHISAQPVFRAHSLLTASTYGGLYGYLALSAFVFIDTLQIGRARYGLLMASISLVYILGTLACRRVLGRSGLVATVRVAGRVSQAACACLLAAALWQLGLMHAAHTLSGGADVGASTTAQASAQLTAYVPAWSLLPGMWLYAFAHGIHQPCGQTGVVSAFQRQAGAASALSGFVLSSCAVIVGALLSAWTALPGFHDAFFPMTLGMALGAWVTSRMALGRVQRDGAPPATEEPLIPAESQPA
jgi:DHA1 family bicyclomycin/chloramphenicol resistance-like MFS transporter